MHKYKFFFRISKIIFLTYNFIINLFCIFINKQSSDIFKITNFHVFSKFSKKVIESHNLKFNAENKTLLSRALRLKSKEPDLINWIDKIFEDGDIFYDIGANIGIYSIYSSNKYNITTYSFEPEQNNFNELCKNIFLNKTKGIIHPINFALSNKYSMSFTNLHISNQTPGKSNHSIIQKKQKKFTAQKVIETSIDYLISNKLIKKPNHIKIDVDGIENLILVGSSKFLKMCKLKSLVIEFNCSIEQRNKIIKFLKSCNLEKIETSIKSNENTYFLSKKFIRKYSNI